MSALRWALALAAGIPVAAAGQLAERVAGVGDGTVRFAYDARPGVEICEQGIRWGDRHVVWHGRGWDDPARSCRYGSVELELRVEEGEVRDVDLLRRREDRTPTALDLGPVPARETVDYLLSLARTGPSHRVARSAVLPAMIADVDDIWRDLLVLARDADVRRDVRKSALFWLGQEAADAATEGLASLAADEEEEQEIRDAAVFALSQRPEEEGVPILMELARTAREPETRKTAMFWLAQSRDERVLDFFEEILLRRGPGD